MKSKNAHYIVDWHRRADRKRKWSDGKKADEDRPGNGVQILSGFELAQVHGAEQKGKHDHLWARKSSRHEHEPGGWRPAFLSAPNGAEDEEAADRFRRAPNRHNEDQSGVED